MAKAPMFCSSCGAVGPPRSFTPGSFIIEVFAWFLLIIPGVIYSLWRVSARRKVCGSCGAATLMPPDSPMARQFQRGMNG